MATPDPLDGACAIWSATGLPHSPSGLAKPWASGLAAAAPGLTSPLGLWMLPVLWPGPLGLGASLGRCWDQQLCPPTRGPLGHTSASPVRCGPGAVLWGKPPTAGRGAGQGHVPRVTQPLNGRAERQMGSPKLLAAASFRPARTPSPPGPASLLQPPQGLLRPHPPALPGHACVCCRAPSLPEH